MPKARRVVCLDFELAEIRNAVGAAAVLLDMLTIDQFPNEETERQAVPSENRPADAEQGGDETDARSRSQR